MKKNPKALVFANDSVSKMLTKEGVEHAMVMNGHKFQMGDVGAIGIGEKHAPMHSSIPLSSNLGFFIDDRLWYPGDAFTDPMRVVEILALPVSGPWLTIGQAIDYALLLKPKFTFPVHDGIRFGSAHIFTEKILNPSGISFVPMVEGDSKEF